MKKASLLKVLWTVLIIILSSATAFGSFHGTRISLIQFPTEETRERAPHIISDNVNQLLMLPEDYSVVPAVTL